MSGSGDKTWGGHLDGSRASSPSCSSGPAPGLFLRDVTYHQALFLLHLDLMGFLSLGTKSILIDTISEESHELVAPVPQMRKLSFKEAKSLAHDHKVPK